MGLRVIKSVSWMFLLFVCLVCIWTGGCKKLTREQVHIKRLGHKKVEVRWHAVQALVRMGTPEAIKAVEGKVPDLIQALQNPDAKVRIYAIWALGSIGAKDAVPAMIQTLQDSDAKVRWNAASTLVGIGTPEALKVAVPALIQLLQDPDAADLRWNTGTVLVQIGIPEAIEAAVPVLLQVLKDQEVGGPVELRLDLRGTPEKNKVVVPILIQVLQDEYEDPEVRGHAADALRQIDTPEVLKAVEEYRLQ